MTTRNAFDCNLVTLFVVSKRLQRVFSFDLILIFVSFNLVLHFAGFLCFGRQTVVRRNAIALLPKWKVKVIKKIYTVL